MANYYGAMRTNYFRVKDEEKFRNLMNSVCCGEDEVRVWCETDNEGVKRFGFGAFDSIRGICASDDEDEEPDYDAFAAALQACVAEDDAIIIFEAGHEKLRYVGGSAEIITAKEHKFINLHVEAVRVAGELLRIEAWETRCDW